MRRRSIAAVLVGALASLAIASAVPVDAEPDGGDRSDGGTDPSDVSGPPVANPESWPPFTRSSEVRDIRRPDISGDGRWVVAEADLADRTTVLRIDRSTGRTVEITPVPDGLRPGDTVHPVISEDGCVVAVVTELALDPFRDDDSGARWDVYRIVVPECGGSVGRWELVSTGDDGTSRDDVDASMPPAVAAAGGVIAFTHSAAELVARSGARSGSPTATTTSVSVVDLAVPIGAAGRVEQVPALPAEPPTGAFRYRGVFEPAISADGRTVAFTADTTADDPLPGWATGPEPGGPATSQVFVWDRDDIDRRTRIEMVSVRHGSGEPSGGASSPVLSADGDVVLFVSTDADLTETARRTRCDDSCPSQVYRYERALDDSSEAVLTAVSAAPDRSGVMLLGDGDTAAPAIDRRADRVVVLTRSSTLVAGRIPLDGDLGELAGDVESGELLVADADRDLMRVTDTVGTPGVPAIHGRAAVSSNGRVVVAEAIVGGAAGAPMPLGPVGSETGRGLIAWVATPQVVLADLDFGTVLAGWEGDELYVSVRNDGPGSFAPHGIATDSAAFRVVPGGTCAPGVLVPAGGSCTVHVGFTPIRELPHAAVLTVTEESEVASDVVSVSAVVTGSGGEPTLRAEPGGIDLGEAAVGGVGERRAVDIRNIGAVPTEVIAIELRGRNPGDFEITAEACTGRALNPGATCAVEIEFAPTGPSLRTASVSATTITGASTAAIVGGVARYEPAMGISSTTVTPGARLGVGVNGFPPDTDVRLSLDGGITSFAIIRTDAVGGMLLEVVVPRRTRGGARYLSAHVGHLMVDEPIVVLRPPDGGAGVPGYGLGQG